MSKHKNLQEIIDFIMDGDVSDLSDLSDDENESFDYEINSKVNSEEAASEDSSSDEEEDNMPLINIAGQNPLQHSSNDREINSCKDRIYRWRKRDIPWIDNEFSGLFSDPPENLSTLEYFSSFFPDDLVDAIVQNTNLYSVQCKGKSVNTNSKEIKTFIGINMLMGIVKLPQYFDYWSNTLRYPAIADVMSRNRFSELRRYLHFVDNNSEHDKEDKLFKIRPIIEAVRNQCIKIEPEEFQSVDEQIIPSKTRFTKIRQYNPKKPKKWGFKNLVRAGSSGFMYDFYLYSGKETTNNDVPYNHLQKSAQVVAKLCQELPGQKGHKLFFDNWFSTLELFHYLKDHGIHAVGTIRANRLQGCPLESVKDLTKQGRGSYDYRVDLNSAIIIVRWMDNSVVQLASNFVGVNPVGKIDHWVKSANARSQVDCPQIVLHYNKSMGGVDLADMLIQLYRIEVKTTRWYIKVFWHMVDIAKVNSWLLYRRHQNQLNIPLKKPKTLANFTKEIAAGLMHTNKSLTEAKGCGRPKRSSIEASRHGGKKPAIATPCSDVRFDQYGHWPIPTQDKKRCRLCQSYSRITCEKCGIHLCLNGSRNCFKTFHHK